MAARAVGPTDTQRQVLEILARIDSLQTRVTNIPQVTDAYLARVMEEMKQQVQTSDETLESSNYELRGMVSELGAQLRDYQARDQLAALNARSRR